MFLVSIALAAMAMGQPLDITSGAAEVTSVGSFTFNPIPSKTYATPNEKSSITSYHASHYTDVSSIFGNLSTSTWGSWDPDATATPTDSDDPYGSWAWTQLWVLANVPNYTNTALYSTTVEPSAIPSESLVLPPKDPLYFNDTLKFPEGFIFGLAGSASQIEGAVAEEGRTPTVMELLISDDEPKNYVTNENYYLYKVDIARLAAMGVKTYSFTIPWTRILPFVLPGSPVNQQAIDHYNDLINTCIEYGITPMATLTHYDSPLWFNEGKPPSDDDYDYDIYNYGGYSGSWKGVSFGDAFVNYGKIALAHFADRVPLWVGFNEPLMYTGYASSFKVVVQSTARLHKFYHEELGGTGKFGIKFNDDFGLPLDPSNSSHVEAAERYNDIQIGAFARPLFLGQQPPQLFLDTFGDGANLTYTDAELAEVAGGSDFLGIDPYTITILTPAAEGVEECQADRSNSLWPWCVSEGETFEDGWKVGYRSQSYVYITPVELREYLNYLHITYKSPIFITEFGFPEWREGEKELGDQLYDINRSTYYRSFLGAALEAIHEDGVDIIGAIAWSFADNWEFGDYKQQFGLQVVNRTTQERYYKKSFFDIIQYVNERSTY